MKNNSRFILILAAVLILVSATALGAKLKVDQSDPACGPAGPVYCTIQDAIDVADPGDKVEVKKGVYVEDLVIEVEGLELEGSGCHGTVIEGVATNPGPAFPLAAPNIDIRANGVRIHHFAIRSPALECAEYSSGIVLTGTNIEVDHNCFEAGTGDGSQAIQTWSKDNAPVGLRDISGLHIHHNRFSHRVPPTTCGAVDAYEGIYVNEQSDPVDPADPVVIEHNNFSGELIRAVTTRRSQTTIGHNKLSTDYSGSFFPSAIFGTRGIQLSGISSEHVVAHNKIDGKGLSSFQWGILVGADVTSSAIEKNHIKGSATDGIQVNGDENEIVENDIKGSGNDGILVNGDDNTIAKNHVKGSGNLDYEDTGAGNTFTKNK